MKKGRNTMRDLCGFRLTHTTSVLKKTAKSVMFKRRCRVLSAPLSSSKFLSRAAHIYLALLLPRFPYLPSHERPRYSGP